jgi:hypothetical protein
MEDQAKNKDTVAREAVRAILQDGVDFEVSVNKKTLLRRLRILPKSRKFIIYPINLGTLFNISKIIINMGDLDNIDKDDLFMAGIDNILKNKGKMIDVVVLGIMNRKINSPWARFKQWRLARYIDRNLSASELFKLIQLIILQMDVSDFLASFVSIKRLNLVEATKKKQSSSIIGKL